MYQPPQQPSQGQRPQQNTQYPPQWQPRPPYPQKPYQPPPVYYPPPQYYPQMPPPMRQPPKKGLSPGKIVLIVIGVILVCGLLNVLWHADDNAVRSTSTSDVQSTDTSNSDTPTIALTTGPSINIAPIAGPAIIGAEFGTLVARYGEPQDQSDSSNYDFKDGNGKIYLSVFVEQGRVQGLIYNPITTDYWTRAEGKAACLGFAPPDSQYQRKYDLFDATNALI